MKTYLFLYLILLGLNLHSQTPQTVCNNKPDTSKNDFCYRIKQTNNSACINFSDTLRISNISEKGNTDSFTDKNMPWIVALSIGLLSVLVNFWVAHRLRQSNERNLKKQI